jgi:DNA mismatch repair protein MutL
MNRIHLLPDNVANQIAAGEVVDRPASVVKELVENSLDAESTRITVEVQAGGRSVIRVTDDGLGMSRDDALLCLERHATSKIRKAEDLASVVTMGFRGEALPSIASVSRFTLTTRERENDSPEGTQVQIAGGKILEVKAAGTAPGTSLEVRQLFYNLPARRKFLRSEETEASHIQHYLLLAALANPEVAFTFIKDSRVVWQLPSVKSGTTTGERIAALRERMRGLHGAGPSLLDVNFSGVLGKNTHQDFELAEAPDADTAVRLWGVMGAPGVSRSTREDQHLFVNRRPVENRGLNFALLEGYHTALMRGRYPVCCLFLEIDPAEVDVNIHPAKREVKFHREMDVRRTVTSAIRQVLLDFHTQPAASAAPARPASPVVSAPAPEQPALPSLAPMLPTIEAVPKPAQPPLPIGFRPETQPTSTLPHTSGREQPHPPQREADSTAAIPPPPTPAPPAPAGPVPLLQVPMRLVGVVGKLYVLLESDRGLVLLDQHAAHERILFEQMLNRLEQKEQAASQRLLLPETVELAPRDAHFLRQQLPVLTRLGVGLSEFGERTFLLDALPPFVKASDPRRFVLELVDELRAAGQTVNTLRLGEHTVAKTVCRHAVKANDPLGGRELENLVEDLRRCSMPYTCPHGRPTLIEMNYKELEKKFGRVV